MEIQWLGHGCFRLRGRDATVLTNPCPPTTGYKIGRVNADVLTISRNLVESSYRQAAPDAKVLTGPGEYEIAGVLITGVGTDHEDGKRAQNTAFVIDIDDVRVCHLGDITQVPSGDDIEALSAADVLLVPVGGGRVFGPEKAAECVSLLEPRFVIPMQYKTDVSTADLEPVEKFVREMGAEMKAPEQRLNVTKSTVPGDTTLVLLNYRG